MKEFKGFILLLLMAAILVAAYAWHDYNAQMAPVWNARYQQQTTLAIIDQQNALIEAAKRRADFTDALRFAAWVAIGLCAAIGGMYVWTRYDMRQESRMRAVDGTFALQQFSSNGQVYLVDPNKALFGAQGLNKLTGDIITDAQMVGPDRQLTYVNNVQRTRSIAAKQTDGRKPSRNELLAESGFFDNKARAEDARAQLVERRLLASEFPQLPVHDDGDAMPSQWQRLALIDAFSQSTPDRWLLGQNDQGPCEFDVFSTVHTGLLGATKCGKTSSTALLMASNAAKHGMKVIALDGAGGVDWQPYGDKFEVYETDYTMIGDQLDQIVKLHDRRTKDLKLAGKPNIDELDYRVPSLFVILEEFGRTMQSFKAASRVQYDATVTALSNLMRVSRKTGIYFLLIDQSMAGWDQLIKPNIKDYISYHLGGNQGAAFNAYKLHELKPKGQFWNNGNVYDAWYTRGEVKPLLQKLPALRTKMLTDSQAPTIAPTIDSTIVERGESTAKTHPPKCDSRDSWNNSGSPVSDSQPIVGDSRDSQPQLSSDYQPTITLTGKPLSQKEKNLVRNTFALTNQNRRKTVELLYGSWTVSRDKWIKEILNREVLQ